MLSSNETSKGKNKNFARKKIVFAMSMPMPTSMPMLMPRWRCRDFQMALNLFNVGQIYIIDQKIKQLALQINLQC